MKELLKYLFVYITSESCTANIARVYRVLGYLIMT
jgi:hypothetical protein